MRLLCVEHTIPQKVIEDADFYFPRSGLQLDPIDGSKIQKKRWQVQAGNWEPSKPLPGVALREVLILDKFQRTEYVLF